MRSGNVILAMSVKRKRIVKTVWKITYALPVENVRTVNFGFVV